MTRAPLTIRNPAGSSVPCPTRTTHTLPMSRADTACVPSVTQGGLWPVTTAGRQRRLAAVGSQGGEKTQDVAQAPGPQEGFGGMCGAGLCIGPVFGGRPRFLDAFWLKRQRALGSCAKLPKDLRMFSCYLSKPISSLADTQREGNKFTPELCVCPGLGKWQFSWPAP